MQRATVTDVRNAFRNTVRMIARLYDALDDPKRKDILTTPTDTGNGGLTHKFFKAPKNAEELVGCRDAIAEWARVTYGWIGRSPDYKAAFLATLGANSAYYAPYEENAKRWYKKVQEEVSFVNHAIVNPPVDRDKPLDEVKDVYMHVTKERDDGLVVSGAKVVATTSSLTHFNFIANNGALPIKTKVAFVCMVPTDAGRGCSAGLIWAMATAMGTPFGLPLRAGWTKRRSDLQGCLRAVGASSPRGDIEGERPSRGQVPPASVRGCASRREARPSRACCSRRSEPPARRFPRHATAVGEVLAWRNF